jgi:hypothetical protein
MCGGGEKRARRAAEQQAREFEESMLAAEKRNQEMVTALKPKFTPGPMETGAALEDNGGVRKKRARKSSIIDANKGVSSLRIGLNTGNTGSGSGPNMG